MTKRFLTTLLSRAYHGHKTAERGRKLGLPPEDPAAAKPSAPPPAEKKVRVVYCEEHLNAKEGEQGKHLI
ncbi:hypothetical protein E2562_019417 [Oryza meyeriana var. granulata]|uniref:Uncharacterized protein n=1 Tax=Oryza meyeriana var. granulata TaxID=110450 RepID=A0A6G1DJM9_9ORYZ|nr:hypothetical protein E2562_019417 [Oryza meyeriana var. granulata]KAF0912828.1 hypothetical protein E2562_019417 [Oryza meyeriana var. granulata]